MIDMGSIDVEGWLSREVVAELAQQANINNLTGDGIEKAAGILTSIGRASEFDDVNSGNASTMPTAYTKFFDMVGKVKFGYGNKKWYTNRTTLVEIWKYADANNRFYISELNPFVLRGFPIVDTPDMSDIAANAFPVMFGDLKSCYYVINNPKMNVIRDPFTAKGFVLFYTSKYKGGGVVKPETMTRLKIST